MGGVHRGPDFKAQKLGCRVHAQHLLSGHLEARVPLSGDAGPGPGPSGTITFPTRFLWKPLGFHPALIKPLRCFQPGGHCPTARALCRPRPAGRRGSAAPRGGASSAPMKTGRPGPRLAWVGGGRSRSQGPGRQSSSGTTQGTGRGSGRFAQTPGSLGPRWGKVRGKARLTSKGRKQAWGGGGAPPHLSPILWIPDGPHGPVLAPRAQSGPGNASPPQLRAPSARLTCQRLLVVLAHGDEVAQAGVELLHDGLGGRESVRAGTAMGRNAGLPHLPGPPPGFPCPGPPSAVPLDALGQTAFSHPYNGDGTGTAATA